MPARTPRVLTLSFLAAALALTTLSAPARGSDPDPTTPPADRASEAAEAALATVRDLLDGVTPPGQGAAPGANPELTLALRDLALLKDDLPAGQRPAAERLLARPTDGSRDEFGDGYTVPEEEPVCSDALCVHYVTSSRDRVPAADGADLNDVPDYVDFALQTLTHVHDSYVAAGYRAPKSDEPARTNGGDGRPDIYLADVGDDRLFGYCATDQDLPANRPQDTWAYCVLDNDYSARQFGTRNTPRQNLQVTAAHEYFHAVQFGYDVSEDGWVMESTATWAEDEIYDRVNDNVAYLRDGPMRLPHRSLDQFSGLFHYGSWIFFRFLTEHFPAERGGMPVLVRDLWHRLDDSAGGIGDYSLQGLKKVLRRRGVSITEAFAGFSAANRMPGRNYDEGRSNRYPKAPLLDTLTLGRRSTSTGRLPVTLDHLAAGTVRYTPGRKLYGAAWRLRLVLDMKPRWKGSGAVVTIKPRNGAPRMKWVPLNRNGDARPKYGFSRGRVKFVEVTLVNASDHFRCHRQTRFSCEGQPKFDNSVERIRARIFKAR